MELFDSNILTVKEVYYEVNSSMVKVLLQNNIGLQMSMGLKSLIETITLHD